MKYIQPFKFPNSERPKIVQAMEGAGYQIKKDTQIYKGLRNVGEISDSSIDVIGISKEASGLTKFLIALKDV